MASGERSGASRNGTFGLGCEGQVYYGDLEVKRRRGSPAGGKSRSKGTEAEKLGMYRANSLTGAEEASEEVVCGQINHGVLWRALGSQQGLFLSQALGSTMGWNDRTTRFGDLKIAPNAWNVFNVQ